MLSCHLLRWWWLRLALTLRGYEAEEIPVLNQILYFLHKLYEIIRSVPVVPMELTISRVISFGGV